MSGFKVGPLPLHRFDIRVGKLAEGGALLAPVALHKRVKAGEKMTTCLASFIACFDQRDIADRAKPHLALLAIP